VYLAEKNKEKEETKGDQEESDSEED